MSKVFAILLAVTTIRNKQSFLLIAPGLFLVLSMLLPGQIVAGSTNGFQIDYHLTLEEEDYPRVEVGVTNAPLSATEFAFWTYGSSLGAIQELKTIFEDMRAETVEGYPLDLHWEGNNEIVVHNGHHADFVIEYTVDALNLGRSSSSSDMGESQTNFVVFRAKRIFFIAGDVFVLPKAVPRTITTEFSLPAGTKMFSSLSEKDDTFIAVADLWGNILYDFQKAYFTGGEPVFYLDHYTEWGDKYSYIRFDADPVDQAWLPPYGDTHSEQAKEYMKTTEMFAKYFREVAMGPLPQHSVQFTNVINFLPFSVQNHTDWFHFMQIWPEHSEPEVCHHLFHQYSFWVSQSKLAFDHVSPIGGLLSEGLPTYFEQVVPTVVFSDNRYQGKLFEFFVLNER